jgi:hypothetical protein
MILIYGGSRAVKISDIHEGSREKKSLESFAASSFTDQIASKNCLENVKLV